MIIDRFFLELLYVEVFLIRFYQSYKPDTTGIFLMAVLLFYQIGVHLLLPIQQLPNSFPTSYQS
jgi:hypothetical protein